MFYRRRKSICLRTPGARPVTRPVPPLLEVLEDRLAPAIAPLPGWDALGDHAATAGRREVVVVDPRVPDQQLLLAGLQPGTEVVLLSATGDGLSQIADALAGPAQTTDLHLLGHGTPGGIELGGGLVTAATMTTDTAALRLLAAELGPDSDVLLYGCQAGAGTAGTALVDGLAHATGAEVAASSSFVGSAGLGGTWDLNVATGPIDAAAPLAKASLGAYPDLLGLTITTTTLPNAYVTQGYDQAIGTSGGTGPVTFSVVGGSLPTGLSLDPSTGVISGVATVSSFSTLYSFDDTYDNDGSDPHCKLYEDASGDFYGTAAHGGPDGDGTVFELVKNASTYSYQVLGNFNGNNGMGPIGGLVADSSGNLYGTTFGIVSNAAQGTIFEIPANNPHIKTLYTFGGTDNPDLSGDGAQPLGDLALNSPTGHFLYGACYSGGANNTGCLFKFNINTPSSPPTILHSFGSSGGFPVGALVEYQGNFYGTTTAGGSGNGSVFEYSPGSSTYTTLANFAATVNNIAPNGSSPNTLVVDGNGDLFGTTRGGGAYSSGTIFEVVAGSGAITDLSDLNGPDDYSVYPNAQLAIDGNGDLFGTTQHGGYAGYQNEGTVFELPAGASQITTLVDFNAVNAGANPMAPVIMDSQGDLFGATSSGGTYGSGTIYELAHLTFSVQATDSVGATASKTYALEAMPYPQITTTTLPNWTVGQPYNQTVQSTGGLAPVIFGVSGNLPPGLTVYTNGSITGTPTTSSGSPFTFTVSVTDQANTTSSETYTVAINPVPVITTTALPSWTVGQPYSQTVQETGGTSPFTFNVSAGNLPTGLSLNGSTGAITGTPTTTTGSPFTFTIELTDAAGATATQGYTLAINPVPTITTTTLTNWTVGQPYSQTVQEAGGTSPFSFVVSAGSLPTGLSLNGSTGVLTGTPTTTVGSPFSFTIKLTDAASAVASKSYTIAINAVPIIATTSLPNWTVGQPYAQTILESGGTSPLTFLVSAGALPTGLSLNGSTGAITGTPTTTTGSPFSFTIKLTDAAGATFSESYTVAINPVPVITTTSLPNWTVGQPYSQTILESGGTSPFTFLVSAGSLPTGLSLNGSTGAITGTPTTTTGSPFTFTIELTDLASAVASKSYTVVINSAPVITTTTLPNWTVGQTYSQTVFESGGTSPFTFIVSAGALPTGLSLNGSTGAITGTPTTTTGSPFTFTIKLTDAASAAASKSYTVTINPAPVITTTVLPNWTVGQPYAQTLQESGGTTPLTFAVSAGSLPTGLSLNGSTGAITGTPTTTTGSPFTFTIQLTDAVGAAFSQTYTVAINPAPVITTTTLPNWTVGQPYAQTILESGGTSPLTFTMSSGSLPTGLSLNGSTGAITGTPTTTSGSPFSFTIRLTDAANATYSQSYTVAINPTLSINPTTLPTALAGSAYSQIITVAGGTTPYPTFSVTAFNGGTTGLTSALFTTNPNAGTITLSGTPAAPGSATFTVNVTDSAGATLTENDTLVVNQTPAITSANNDAFTVGTAGTFTVTATGTPSPTLSDSPTDTLPAGITFNPNTGVLSGTALGGSAGTYLLHFFATNSVGSANQTFTLTVNPPLTTTTTLTDSGPDPSLAGVGVSFSGTVTASSGSLITGESVAIVDTTTGSTVANPTVTNGVFAFSLATLALGSHALEAVYAGDAANPGSQSTPVTQTVLATFGVDRVVAISNEVVITFDAPVSEASLRLYATPSATATNPADITVVGASTGPVKGSLVLDPTNPYLATFVKTIGLLAPDTYTVTVTAPVADINNVTLPGTSSTSLTVPAPTGPVVAVPYFARGAGQPVNLPANSTAGIPITLSGLSGALTSASFTLTYDPTLLNITAETLAAAAVAAGLTLNVTPTALDAHHEQLAFHLSGGTWTPGNSATLVSLTATVPATAPYLDKALLNLSGVTVNSGSASSESAVDEAAYLGDVAGTRTLTGADATYINLVIASTASNAGFSACKDLDPVIIGGIAYGEANVSSTDATRIEQKLVGTSVPTIPTIPTGIIAPTGADPHLFLGSASVVAGQVVTIPEELVDTATVSEPILGVDSVLFFDPRSFTVVGVTDGALLAGYDVIVNVDEALGTIQVTQSTVSPLTLQPGEGGVALDIELLANGSDAGGAAVVKLGAGITRGGVTEATAVLGTEGACTLTPAPQGQRAAAAFVPGVDAVIQVTVAPVVPQGSAGVATSVPLTTDPEVLLAGPLVRSLPGASATAAAVGTVPATEDILTPQSVGGTPASPVGSADHGTATTASLDAVWDLELVLDPTTHEVAAGMLLDRLALGSGKR